MYQAKAGRDGQRHFKGDASARQQLRELEERLSKAEADFEALRKRAGSVPLVEPVKKSRRWFKGLGQIGQGTAISIANVSLAVGALHLPVSPETATWGAIASVATGLGAILNGIGDLRGE